MILLQTERNSVFILWLFFLKKQVALHSQCNHVGKVKMLGTHIYFNLAHLFSPFMQYHPDLTPILWLAMLINITSNLFFHINVHLTLVTNHSLPSCFQARAEESNHDRLVHTRCTWTWHGLFCKYLYVHSIPFFTLVPGDGCLWRHCNIE